MQPEDLAKEAGTLLVFFLLFSPGFVALKAFDFWSSAEPRKASDYLYEIFGYGCVNYAVLSPYIIGVIRQDKWETNYDLLRSSAIICLLVAPAILGSFVALVQWFLVECTGRTFVGSTKTAWDWAFKKVGRSGVIVELQDGTEIAGSYTRSAGISAYPYDPAIYLDRLWTITGTDTFVNAIPNSKGQYIDGKHIKTIRFCELPPEPT